MFEWKDVYSVKISEIDSQHKQLFKIGENLATAIKISNTETDHYDEIVRLINELKSYTVYHFQHEESIMRKIGYANYENHKAEHDAFIEKISELQKQDIYINQKNAMMNILTFLLDWISKHILKSDMAYTNQFKENGIF